MRTATPALQAFLASKLPFWTADLFTFTLRDGTVNRWTSADRDIWANTNLFSAFGPALTRTRWAVKNTIEVPEMEIKMLSNGSDYSGSNIKLLIHNGLLDGAQITLERAFMPTFGDTSAAGVVLLFSGYASSITIGALGATIKTKGANVYLQRYMPRNNYTLSCVHTVYDAGCTLNRSSFTSGNQVAAGSSDTYIKWDSSPPYTASRYALGTLTFTTGVCEGQTRTIDSVDSSGFILSYPLYETPATGDHFTIQVGCDRSLVTCNLFSNSIHYRGFPFIPPAETGY